MARLKTGRFDDVGEGRFGSFWQPGKGESTRIKKISRGRFFETASPQCTGIAMWKSPPRSRPCHITTLKRLCRWRKRISRKSEQAVGRFHGRSPWQSSNSGADPVNDGPIQQCSRSAYHASCHTTRDQVESCITSETVSAVPTEC